MERAVTLGIWALSVPALTGCSLTVAQGFRECTTDADCPTGRVCAERYCVAAPAGCESTFGATDKTNRIPFGATLPLPPNGALDGGADEAEKQRLNALVLALDEVNHRGGVGGRPLALYLCRSGGDDSKAAEQTTWLTEQVRVPAVFTSGNAQTLAAATVSVPHDVLLMTATSTGPELTALDDANGGPVGLVWRTAPSDALQGKALSAFLLSEPAFGATTRLGVAYTDDAYGKGLQQAVLDAYGAVPGKTARGFAFTPGGTVAAAVKDLSDFAPQVTVLVAGGDDALRVLAAALAKPVLTKAQGHRWFFTDSAKGPTLLTALASNEITLAYGTAPAQAKGSAFPGFRDRFKAKYASDPSSVPFTANSYDAMTVVALAAAWAAGSDGSGAVDGPGLAGGLSHLAAGSPYPLAPDQLGAAMTALAGGDGVNVEGASGHLDFDSATGDTAAPIELWQISADAETFLSVKVLDTP